MIDLNKEKWDLAATLLQKDKNIFLEYMKNEMATAIEDKINNEITNIAINYASWIIIGSFFLSIVFFYLTLGSIGLIFVLISILTMVIFDGHKKSFALNSLKKREPLIKEYFDLLNKDLDEKKEKKKLDQIEELKSKYLNKE